MVRRSLGILHLEQGDLPAARAELDASLLLARQSGDDEGAAQTLVELARLRAREGDLGAAQAGILSAAGRPNEATDRYLEAASAFRHLGMTGELIRALRDPGFALMGSRRGAAPCAQGRRPGGRGVVRGRR